MVIGESRARIIEVTRKYVPYSVAYRVDALGVKQNKYMNNYKRGYVASDQVTSQSLLL